VELRRPSIYQALLNKYTECAKIIVKIPGVMLNFRSSNGNSLAHWAALGNIDSVQVLEDISEIRWNDKNDLGNTPILEAFEEENFDVVKYMISMVNVDTTIKDREGNTLKDLCRQKGDTDILELLADQKIRELEEQIRKLKTSKKNPECPVCFEEFEKNSRIYSCVNGHFICSDCKLFIQVCPR